jgi:hypothetical protein
MKYTELKELHQEKLTELSNKVGLFWAFNREQFAEGMKENPTTGKYTSIGMGGYLPSENVEKYLEGMKELDEWYKAERKKIKKEEAILYELNNYECFYTGDITNAYEVLKDIYTKEEVRGVYLSNRSQANC